MPHEFHLYEKGNPNRKATLEIKQESDTHRIEGEIQTHNAWSIDNPEPSVLDDSFFAEFCIKWDGCSHWNFYGEDYCGGEKDSYYHLCGSYCYKTHMACIWFAWRTAEIYFNEHGTDFPERGELHDFDEFFDGKYEVRETKGG